METYNHKVTGIYANREEAENALNRLLELGMSHEQLEILDESAVAAQEDEDYALDMAEESDDDLDEDDYAYDDDYADDDDDGSGPRRTRNAVRNKKVLKDVLVDGGIGAAVGTGIAGLAEVALIAANVSLFVASPIIAPLAMLGWGASVGGVVGAAIGAGSREGGRLSELVGDAIDSGSVVLVAHTATEEETALAQEIIRDSIDEASADERAPRSSTAGRMSGKATPIDPDRDRYLSDDDQEDSPRKQQKNGAPHRAPV